MLHIEVCRLKKTKPADLEVQPHVYFCQAAPSALTHVIICNAGNGNLCGSQLKQRQPLMQHCLLYVFHLLRWTGGFLFPPNCAIEMNYFHSRPSGPLHVF